MSVRLGPFEIRNQFATGGMGEIWHGIHVEQQMPVAIKVITGPNALLPEYMEEFRREVQAVARLNHPNVVQVFDYGTLPDEVEELDGGLLAGAPYLVMEYASRGSLANQVDPLNWRDLKNILMSTLGGLAHAHARGVIHRDIKPGNVLLGSHHESPPRIILTDFGVAHATDHVTRTDAVELTARSTEEASGTPRYMAPEQFMGRWRDYGPATDLYAVGIMAYHLVCGQLPFKGGTFMLLAMAHINNPFPELKPLIDVPKGFEDWVRRLTEKSPHDRYKSAANAAWALTQLDDSAIVFSELSNIAGDTGDDGNGDDFDDTDMLPTRIDFALPEAIRVFQMSKSVKESGYKDVPPLPVTWGEAEPPKAQVSLVGSGLGLFGLRSIPLVGRETERSLLWTKFKEVQTGREPRAVVIRGLGGTGKSGLVEWFYNLVEEIGAATTFRANHSETPGLMHGLGWMLNRHFRAAGLPPADLEERLTEVLTRHDIEDRATVLGLVEIMRTEMKESSGATSAFVRFTAAEQRYQVIRDVIDATNPERPVVMWMDDAHWEPDTIAFVDWLLSNPGVSTHPKLCLLTIRDEDLDEAAALDALIERDEVTVIDLAPLNHEDTAQLVREHLYLPMELANDVARRAVGSPLFAIQLVEDWVKRGVLEVEGGSFVVRRGEIASLPTDASELWRNRFDHLIAELTTSDDEDEPPPMTKKAAETALELAASLGQDVDLEEWGLACEMARIKNNNVVLDALTRQRLATQSESSLSFVNAQLVEMLRTQCREANRWIPHNMLLARMLTTRYGGDHPGLAQRVGRHFVEAKAHQLAVTCLEEAYQRAHGNSEQREISEINDLLTRCYESMGVPERDIRWAELWVRRAVPKIYSPDPDVFEEGITLLTKAEHIARELNRNRTLAGILRAQAWASIHAGAIPEGIERAGEALELTSPGGSLEASCHRTLGHLLLVDGQLAAAIKHLERAIELAPRSVHAIWARQQLASAYVIKGELDRAEDLLESALNDAVNHGVLLAEAQIYETWAFVAERRGQFARAEERHREALTVRASISSESTLHAKSREYVARAILAQDRHEEAFELLQPLAEKISSGQKGFFTHLDDALLACAIAEQDWERAEALLETALTFDDFPPSACHARALLQAARLAADAGKTGLAADIYEGAADALEAQDVELEFAEKMREERKDLDLEGDRITAEGESAIVSLDDSGSRFPAANTGQHETAAANAGAPEFPDAISKPIITSQLTEDSDPMDEPDFTGRVQVLSMPVDPSENFGQFGFDLSSEAVDDNWSEFQEEDEGGSSDEHSTSGMIKAADVPAFPDPPSVRFRTTPMNAVAAMPSPEELAELGIDSDADDDLAELDALATADHRRDDD